MTKRVTHDYTKRYWGHDYTFDPINEGKRGNMMGWGHGIENGHFLLIQNGSGSTRYRVESIKYLSDPKDMWSAKVTFAPRKARSVQSGNDNSGATGASSEKEQV